MIPSTAIDLVILDLDGTIIDLFHSGVPSPRVLAAMTAVQAAGIPLTIGTGRTLDYLRQQLSDLRLTCPVITAHGCIIGDPQTGQIYRETTIPNAVAKVLMNWLDESPLTTALYLNDDQGQTYIYQNRPSRTAEDQAFHNHVFGLPRTVHSPLSALLDMPHVHAPMKFICDNNPATEEDFFPLITATFGTQLYLTRSHPRLFEGMAPGVNKGTALRILCEMMQIDPARVMAVGDNDNDIPMLEAAGYGVAMGNATPGVKAVADYVAPSIAEDGAAVVLEWLV